MLSRIVWSDRIDGELTHSHRFETLGPAAATLRVAARLLMRALQRQMATALLWRVVAMRMLPTRLLTLGFASPRLVAV